MTAIEIQAALSAYFAPHEIGWKPQSVSGNRALAVAYIDARNVMDRLDSVLGIENWQDSYTVLPDGNVVCTLTIRVGDEWVQKTDVGGESDQKDEGDRCKAAFSDALKRAAVKLGVGRYLYELPLQWCDYDPQKRQFSRQPVLPDWAMPGREKNRPAGQPTLPAKAPEKPKLPPLSEENARRRDSLKAKDADLFARKLCGQYELMKAAQAAAVKTGCQKPCETWTEEAWQAAFLAADEYEASCLANTLPTEFQLEQLDALIARKGETKERVLAKLRKRPDQPLTTGDVERAIEALSEQPDVQAAQQRKTVKGK